MSNNLAEALKMALEMEKQSHDLYVASSEKSSNAVIKNVLANLANDELSHINIIERFYAALERTQKWPKVDLDALDTRPGEERFNEIVNKIGVELKPDAEYLQVYEFARDKELNARDFYIQQRELNKDDDALNKFFGFLATMEDAHRKMLEMIVQRTQAVIDARDSEC